VPRHNLNFGSRAFRVSVQPRLWNTVPILCSWLQNSQLLLDVTPTLTGFSLLLQPPSDPATNALIFTCKSWRYIDNFRTFLLTYLLTYLLTLFLYSERCDKSVAAYFVRNKRYYLKKVFSAKLQTNCALNRTETLMQNALHPGTRIDASINNRSQLVIIVQCSDIYASYSKPISQADYKTWNWIKITR